MPFGFSAFPRALFLIAVTTLMLTGAPTAAAQEVELPPDAVRVRHRHGSIVIPRGCDRLSRQFDALVHFHGAPAAIEPQFVASKLDAVLVLINLGAGSGRYENKYANAGSLDVLIDRVERAVNRACPTLRLQTLRRIALSSWSAGYGAAFRILSRPVEADRVDAVLLADGLHAGIIDKRRRQVDPLHMRPYLQFAGRAVAGERLLAITHAEIRTTYASATETTDYLLSALSIGRTGMHQPGPGKDLTQISAARAGAFVVKGYSGRAETDHNQHLFHWGETLVPVLRARWHGQRAVCEPEK